MFTRSFALRQLAAAGVLLLAFIRPASAQDLSPRAYFPAPAGTDVLLVGYQYSTGDLAFEPSLPVTGVTSDSHFGLLAYQRFFGLAGRTSSLQLSVPYSNSVTEGFLAGAYARRDLAGFGDAKLRLAINLAGAPTLDVAAFRELLRNPTPIVGASLVVSMPTGEYNNARLLNLGTNRWAAKPAFGMILPTGQGWFLEAEVGVWIFGDNDDFFFGGTREQNPLLSTEIHAVKVARPDLWFSVDANFYTGGRTTVNGEVNQDLQRNSRFGLTVYRGFRGGHALKANLSTGLNTEIGGDFEMLALSYVFAW
ncbi:MAG: transporter [Gammaproteobacteria bacterium]|nr:transporter [Gammaproteobacteria bacterium]MDH4254410.1 transporter [Gammaproteobacteria bacterium]MDH5310759.1 transporter [Gammaproteobacteria bacterium]